MHIPGAALVGQPIERAEDPRLLTGSGQFVDDLQRDGMLHAVVLRSPIAHGRLRRVDAHAARARKGVHAVITAAEVGVSIPVIPLRLANLPELNAYLQPVIARDKVRYVGEPIAVVIADTQALAEDALDAIDVDIERLPALPHRHAAAEGKSLLFEDSGSNRAVRYAVSFGNADAAFAKADYTRRESFHCHRLTALPLETRGLVAEWNASKSKLVVFGAAKVPFAGRRILARCMDLPEECVDLVESDVGGGFGVRGELYPEDILVPLAAMKLGRPVRWIEERRESLVATNHARQAEYQVEMGFDGAGRILGLRALIFADIGAYVRTAALVPAEFGAALFPGPYRVPSYECDLWSVVTNKTPAGTLRSPGRPECNFARERLMDLGASRLGLDPAEIRRRNLIRADEMPYDCGTKSFGASTVYDSGDYPALFEELLRRMDYERARAEQAAGNLRPGLKRGIGLAVYVEKTGLGPFETAHIEARSDGRFVVDTGASSMGPGLETVLAQIVGESLGVATHRFEVRHADTSHVESGVGTYGSRGTVTAGNAAAMAAAKLITEARARAAAAWGVPESDVAYAEGILEAGGRRVTLGELAAQQRLAVGASFNVPKITYAGCAVGVIADVDTETGAVRLARITIGADVGRAVNPALVDAQLVGGVAFGIGNSLHETLEYDAGGQILSGTLMDYALPYASDMPPVEGFYQEVAATTNPLGLRGLGECGNPGLGGAIANAICDALGNGQAGITALPLAPAMVWSQLLRSGSQIEGTGLSS
jgi:carbon-monoxide dehydrogenase large subunit